MKRRTFLGVAGPALTGSVTAALLPRAARAARSTSEKAVLRLEREWLDAMVRREEGALNRLMAADFKRIEMSRPNFSMIKEQWVQNAVRWYRIESFDLLSSKVRGSENSALVSTRYRWRGTLNGAPIHEVVASEDTWEQREGHWQVVSQRISSRERVGRTDKLAAERRHAIDLDPGICLAYVGQYQFGAGRTLIISYEDGRLVRQGSGGQRAELFPETRTRFFRKDAAVLTEFVKKNGRVTHVVHRHPGGRESIGKRIA
jgi:plasmid stability protein